MFIHVNRVGHVLGGYFFDHDVLWISFLLSMYIRFRRVENNNASGSDRSIILDFTSRHSTQDT